MRLSHLILLIVLNFFWAGSLSIYKVLSDYVAPGGIATLRFGTAAVLLLALWPAYSGTAPRGRDLWKTVLMGLVVFTLGHRIQVLGVKLGTAGNSAVLMGVEPILTSVAAALFLREHIGPRRWLGFGLGLLGVAVLNRFQWAGLTASLIFVSCFVCEAFYSIMGKPLIERAGAMKILTLALLIGTAANLLIDGRETFVDARALPAHLWWLVAYLSIICTAVGYGVWFLVIQESDVNIVALTIFAQPVAGLIIAVIWLHERLHWGHLWGSLAIVAGLVVGLSRQIKVHPLPETATGAE